MAEVLSYNKVRRLTKQSYQDDLCYDIPKTTYYSTIFLSEIEEDAVAYKKNPPIEIGSIHYKVNDKFDHIIKAIENSKYLLTLKDDWDTDGAVAINKDVYDRAIKILLDYSKAVFSKYGIVIKSPKISASRDGSIDLDWKTNNSELLITILNTPDFNVDYYGDDGNNNTVIKGFLNEDINEDLLFWMRKI